MPNIEKSPNVLSLDELAEIGAHVVNLCGLFPALGHVSPVGSIVDYCARPESEAGGLVWDMFAVCRFGGYPEARARLDEFNEKYGQLERLAEAVTR